MPLKIDFIKDAAARCTDMLTAAGYSFQPIDNRDAIRTYISIRHRRVRPRQQAPYAIPSHLAHGEQQLLAKVAAGADLWPHQSRRIGNVAAEDGMLNDYGIQHFHLGTMPDPKHPNLMQGTEELLFAVVNDDDFYAIGIFDHSAWSKHDLLNIIQANWPQLIALYAIRNTLHMKVLGLSHNYTDDEIAQLRTAGINVLQQRPDGTIHMGMGGGVTSDSRSGAVTREASRLIRFVKELQDKVIEPLQSKVSAVDLPSDTAPRLEWQDDAPFVVTSLSGILCEGS